MLKSPLATALLVGSLALAPMAAAADDWTDMRYYAAGKDVAHVTAMLDRGVNVNIRNDEGWTPLMIAAEAGDPAMVRLLLSRGADPSLTNKNGRTAYDVTLSSEIRALLKPTTSPSTKSSVAAPPRTTGFTPNPQTPAVSKPSAATGADAERRTFCQAQYRASVAAFCSDDTCKMRENRKWSACLKSGRYN